MAVFGIAGAKAHTPRVFGLHDSLSVCTGGFFHLQFRMCTEKLQCTAVKQSEIGALDNPGTYAQR